MQTGGNGTSETLEFFRSQAKKDLAFFISEFQSGEVSVTSPVYLEHFVEALIPEPTDSHAIETVPLSSLNSSSPLTSLIAVTPADRECVERILQQFKLVPTAQKMLLVIPQVTEFVTQVIEDSGLSPVDKIQFLTNNSDEFCLKDFHADFIPVDNDFFVMPCYHPFYHMCIERDYSDIFFAARSLAKLQAVCGVIPQTVTIGQNAEKVKGLMDSMISKCSASPTAVLEIDRLIIIDRAVDIVSPLTTPVIIEGLIDEFYGIEYGVCCFPKNRDDQEMKIKLNEQDPCFSEVRLKDVKSYNDVLAKFQRECTEIIQEMNEKKQNSAFSELTQALIRGGQQLKKKVFYENATRYLNRLADQIESKGVLFLWTGSEEFHLLQGKKSSILQMAELHLSMFNDYQTALRLVCLEGAIRSVSKDTCSKILTEIVNEFGVRAEEHVATLHRLNLVSSGTVYDWWKVTDSLGCFSHDHPLHEDCQYFVPVSVALVHKAATECDGEEQKWMKAFKDSRVSVQSSGRYKCPTRVLVFFVGGVTLQEVSFIRQLGRVTNKEFIVGGTNTLNNGKFMDEICPGLFQSASI